MNILDCIVNEKNIEMKQPCLCKVGGWEIIARPGDAYTFGQGNIIFGPVRLDEVEPEYDVEGIAYAIPIEKKE